MTIDMEDHTTTDQTLRTLTELRKDFPETGAVLQAYLRRTETDCRALAQHGSRVRLCKGAYDEPPSVAFQERLEVDRSYVRCLRVLMEGEGYPMVATHDPRLIAIAEELARRTGRSPDSYEFQMLLRRAARGAATAGRGRSPGAGLRPLRPGVVPLPDAAPGGAAGQPGLFPAGARVALVRRWGRVLAPPASRPVVEWRSGR